MDSFFTWTDLMTYGGAVMAVLIITEFTKDLPGIRRLSTRLWAYLVALVILLAAAIFTGDSLRVIVAMAAVGSYHSVQEQME